MIIYGKEKEILKAQKRSLAAWINNTIGATLVDADNLISKLSTGVILCTLAKHIQRRVDEAHEKDEHSWHLKYWERAKRETFFARDNAELFIRWCKRFGVREAVLFESDGLVLQTQPRTVILCLLEVARLASHYGILLPPPIQLPATTLTVEDDDEAASDGSDDEILFVASPKSARWDSGCSSGERSPDVFSKTSSPDSSLRNSKRQDGGGKSVVVVVRGVKSDQRSSPPRASPRRSPSLVRTETISSRLRADAILSRSSSSIVSSIKSGSLLNRASRGSSTHSLPVSSSRQRRSPLDKRVSEVARQYLRDEDRMQRLSEGYYSFGDKTVYLRIVRGNNVVVRIGGGWDTLEHFLSVLNNDRKRRATCTRKNGNLKRRATARV